MIWDAKVVFFDFDGVILDTEWPIYETLRDLFIAEGQELPISTYVKCIGSDYNTWSPETHLESLTGKTYDWASINPARQLKIRQSLENPQPMPGVIDLITELHKRAIPTYVVSSSTHHWVDDWLERLDLTNYMQHIICRGDAPKIKPAPDLYLEAVKRSGHQAKDCLVIEDSLNGILSATQAGCRTLAVPNRLTNCLDFSTADQIVSSLSELVSSTCR